MTLGDAFLTCVDTIPPYDYPGGAPTTQMDLKEAGYVIKPSINGAEGQGASRPLVLGGAKGEDVYILYEEEEKEKEEEEGGKGAESREEANPNCLNPVPLRGECSVYMCVAS